MPQAQPARTGRLAGTHPSIARLGPGNPLRVRVNPHRLVTLYLAAVFEGGDVGIHPVVIAALAPVFDNTHPGPTAFQRAPHHTEDCLGHFGVANHIVRLADQLVPGKARNFLKGVIAELDGAFGVR